MIVLFPLPHVSLNYLGNPRGPSRVHGFTLTQVNITVEQVKFAINKLKPGKSDSTDGLLSDNFKTGTYLLYIYIALLFICMLTHGVSPIDFYLSVVVPIPKNKRANKCDSSNYRSIEISSLL